MSLAPLAVIEVAAEPVVIEMPLSAALPVVTVSAPVSELALMSPTSPVTTSAADPVSVSRRILRQGGRGHRHGVGIEVVGDRGGGRAGGDRDAVIGGIDLWSR